MRDGAGRILGATPAWSVAGRGLRPGAVGWLAGGGRAMALVLCLGLLATVARGCLHCHGNFSDKFSFYRHHVNLKSWWVGDIPVSGSLLTDWSQDTMKELHLAIPAEISETPGPGIHDPHPGPPPSPAWKRRLESWSRTQAPPQLEPRARPAHGPTWTTTHPTAGFRHECHSSREGA